MLIEEKLTGKDSKKAWGEVGMRPDFKNPLWRMPLCNVYRLWQPDELHVFFIGLVKTLIGEWLIPFCSARGYEKRFHRRFKRVPRYPQLKRFTKAFHQVQSGSWQGKEMRMMARFLLVVISPIFVTEVRRLRSQLRRIPKATQSSQGNVNLRRKLDSLVHATLTVRALSEAVLLVSQRSHTKGKNPVAGKNNTHTWGSLEYLDCAIEMFHTYKNVFAEQKTSVEKKKAKKQLFRELEIEHATKWELEVGQWRSAKEQNAAEKESISASAIFASPKMHIIIHITKAIEDMGSADNFTTDISELLHKNMIKTGYRASNKNDFEKQILWYND